MVETPSLEVGVLTYLFMHEIHFFRILLGTTPVLKVQWDSEARKKRDSYYVRFIPTFP